MSQYGIIFPGQGSQTVGMLSELIEQHDCVRQTFAEASETLGFDMQALVAENPDDKLNQTQYTQPALLTASIAIWRLWQQSVSIAPLVMAGHSLGEYSALVASGAVSLSQALTLVHTRGQLMQKAVPAGQGAMAAVLGLENSDIAAVCESVANGEVVACANYNAIGQTVIAGDTAAVERALPLLKEKGAKRVMLLPVSVPSHCALMNAIQSEFQQAIAECDWQLPSIPVMQNVSVSMPETVSALTENLVSQLSSPVRWVETVQAFVEQGTHRLIECGPNKVLTGLAKRIDKSVSCLPTETSAQFEQAVAQITATD